MKTWQRSLLCVLFCVVGLNSVVYAWPWPSITLSLDGRDQPLSSRLSSDIQLPIYDNGLAAVANTANPSIVSTPEGHLYAAYRTNSSENYDPGMMISRSIDGGETWEPWAFTSPIAGSGVTYGTPSITYLETDTRKMIFVVFAAMNHSDGSARIELRRLPVDSGPHMNTEFYIVDGLILGSATDQIYPEICTDYPLETSNPSLYVTYSSFDELSDTYPVEVYRSQNLGETWDELQISPQSLVIGIDRPKRPDIEYGTAGLFLVYHQVMNGEYRVAIQKSTDKGDTWDNLFFQILHSPDEPISFPRVTAAIGNPSVLVAYTTGVSGSRDIQYAYSMDGGHEKGLWVTDRPLASTSDDEHSVELGRSKTGEMFYAAYWAGTNTVRGDIHYTFAKTTEPWSWMSSTVVNDARTVSGLYAKPSIHFDPIGPEQGAAIAWTDIRSGGYQIYFNSTSTTINYWSWIPEMTTVTYSMTVENIFEDLNVLTVTNQLSDLVTYTSGSVAVNGVFQEPLAVTDGLWTYSTADLAYGDVLTFSFNVVVDAGVDPGNLISNLINVQYVYGLSNTLLEYSREVVIYVEAIPEPATWVLLGVGLLGGGLLLRRKRRA